MAQPDLFIPRHRVIGSVSGGTGSYSACRRFVDQHGVDRLTLVFTDTLFEDQDAYRFLIASSANLFGIAVPDGALPALNDFPSWEDRPAFKAFVLELAARTMTWLPDLAWIADGRDPWDIYESERFLGNSGIDPCSRVAKREMFARWLAANCEPSETRLIFGIDPEEIERFDDGKGHGIRPRYAKMGWCAEAPLCDLPWSSEHQRELRLTREGLWVPRLNLLGFAHNNCGGFCCKGGHGHWKLMLRVFPERYAFAERREQEIRSMLGDVAMLTDRRGGEGKKPLTLEQLRSRDLTPVEASDMGACGCFFGAAA